MLSRCEICEANFIHPWEWCKSGKLFLWTCKYWTWIIFCGNSVPTKVKIKRDWKPIQSSYLTALSQSTPCDILPKALASSITNFFFRAALSPSPTWACSESRSLLPSSTRRSVPFWPLAAVGRRLTVRQVPPSRPWARPSPLTNVSSTTLLQPILWLRCRKSLNSQNTWILDFRPLYDLPGQCKFSQTKKLFN